MLCLVIKPEPTALEHGEQAEQVCTMSAAHFCVPWVYSVAWLLGMGCQILMTTVEPLVEERLITPQRQGSADAVWGYFGTADKLCTGIVIWLCQHMQPAACADAPEDDAGDSDCGTHFRHVVVLVPALAAVVAIATLVLLQQAAEARPLAPPDGGAGAGGEGQSFSRATEFLEGFTVADAPAPAAEPEPEPEPEAVAVVSASRPASPDRASRLGAE